MALAALRHLTGIRNLNVAHQNPVEQEAVFEA